MTPEQRTMIERVIDDNFPYSPAKEDEQVKQFREILRELLAQADAAAQLAEALAGVTISVKVFHGDSGWDIYLNNAPEMIAARNALAAWRECKK